MFCDQCGAKIKEGDLFCPNCGNRVMQMPKKSKKWLRYAGIGAAVLLLLTLIGFGAYNLVLGRGGRVLMAINNTVKDAPLLVEDLQDAKRILLGDQFLVGIEAAVEDGTVKGEFRNGKKDKQVYISVNNDEYDNLAFLCGVHSGVFRASAQGLDYAFFYDPKQDNEGFLSEDFREKELERLNGLLEGMTSDQMSAEEIRKNTVSALKKELKNLDFEKTEARSWTVNGKERTCKGYRVALDEDNIVRVCEAFGESTQKKMQPETKDAVDGILDIITDVVKDMEFEADISFYFYKGKLAAVVMEDEYQEICVEFQGGDYRMQNIVVTMDNDYFSEELTISSERKGKTETTTIEADDEEISITYNAKSGAMSIESDLYGERCSIEGVYKHSDSEVSYALEDIVVDGNSMMDNVGFTVYARKKPGIEKYEGEMFDLGNASEEDFEELVEDLEEYIDAASDLF